MIRRPPRSTRVRSSAASDVYKRQLVEHRALEAANMLDRQPGLVGKGLCCRSGPDPGLHLAWRQGAGLLDAELLQLRPVATHGSAERLVDAKAILLNVGRRQHEVLAVFVQADQFQLTHVPSRDR